MRTKLLYLFFTLIVLTVPATSISESFNSTYDWNNAPDYSGVTWDGIQDHAQQPTLQQGYQYGSLTEGLVGYWSFEQKRPKGPADTALGNNGTFNGDNDGTLKNFDFNAESGWTEDAKRGSQALEFDGKDDYVSVPDDPSLDVTGDVTVSAWIRVERKDPVGSCCDADQAIVDKNKAYLLNVFGPDRSNPGAVEFGDNDLSPSYTAATSKSVDDGRWHHIVGQYEEGVEKRIYVDGQLITTEITTGSLGTNNNVLEISGDSRNRFVNGKVDDVHIYDRALSSSEINDLYQDREVNRSGLVGEWTFDTGSGTTAHDTSNWKNGKLGEYSGEFDGSDDRIRTSSEIPEKHTLSFWFKSSQLDSEFPQIVSDRPSGSDLRRISVGLNANHEVPGSPNYVIGNTNTKSDVEFNRDVVDASWHHLTATYDGTNQRVYVDGELTNKASPDLDNVGGSQLVIGNHNGLGSDNFFGGKLDSLRIYDRALSTQEVKSLYNRDEREQRIGSQDTLKSGLVGWWPLHETSGSTASDLSGNDNDGSLNGRVTQGVAGKGGLTAYDFDGSDDYVDTDSKDITNSLDTFTWSFWVKTKESGSSSNYWRNPTMLGVLSPGGASNDFEIQSDSGKLAWFSGLGSTDQYNTLNQNVGDGKWHFISVTHTTTASTLYFDGEEVDTFNSDGSTLGNQDIFIGAANNDGPYNTHSGSIQGVRVYDRALSKREIDRLYQNGAGDYATPPTNNDGGVAYWSFDQADSDTRVVEDEWGNHDGVRGTKGGTDQPSITEEGKRGKALSFDGGDDYIETGWTGPSDSLSISTWFKVDETSSQKRIAGNHLSQNDWMFEVNGDRADFQITNDDIGEEVLSIDGANDFKSNSWYHMVGVVNTASGEMEIYVNGRLKYRDRNDNFDSYSPDDSILIGTDAQKQEYFDGKIDELRIYNRSLAKHEVHELYQHGTFGRDMRSLTENRGLVGYWSLDEDSGQTVYDLSGQGNDGTRGSDDTSENSDPTQGANGVLGTSAYDFDGNNDYVSTDLKFDKHDFTYAAWIKADNPSDCCENIIDSYESNSQEWARLYVDSPTDDATFAVDNNGNKVTLSGESLDTGKWYHLAGTRSDGDINLYVNGEVDSEATHSETDVIEGREPETIGARTDQKDGEYFDGKIDEVRIYNRSLTPAEIQSLYSTSQHGSITNEWNAGGPVKPQLTATDWNRPDAPGTSDLVGAWRLNEDHGLSSSGDTTSDWSGNGNDGTTKGGVTTHIDGAYDGSKAYRFDGIDDYVQVRDDRSLDKDRVTVSAWFKLGRGSLSFSGPVRSIIARDNNQNERAWKIGVTDEGIYHAEINAESRNILEPSDNVETGTWTHVTLSYDGSKTRLFENGKLLASASNSGNLNHVSQGVDIGAPAELEDNRYFLGSIDDVRIYSEALSQSSIKSLYQASTVSADVIGGQGSEYGNRFSQEFPFPDGYEAGPGAYEVSWDRPHSETRLNTVLSTPNITKAPSLSAAALNASRYTETTTNQWNKGYKEGVASYRQGQYTGNQDGEIRLGQGRRSDSSLKAHYNFEPKNPGTVTDVSGNGNDGNLKGNSKDGSLNNFDFDADSGWVSGKRGEHALKFDGGEKLGGIDNSFLADSYNSDKEMTVNLWFRIDDIVKDGSFQNLIEFGDMKNGTDSQGDGMRLERDGDSNDTLAFYINTDSGNQQWQLVDIEPYRVKKWHMATFVLDYNENNEVRSYLDGKHDETRGWPDEPWNLSGGSTIEIFSQNNWSDFAIDNLKIYDRKLSNSEIRRLYQSRNIKRSSIVGEWTFDEGSGTVAHDTSKWTTGVRQGKALEFDGSDDYVDVGSSEAFRPDSVSVSFWMKAPTSSAKQRIVGNEGSTQGYVAYMQGDGELYFVVSDEDDGSTPFTAPHSSRAYDDSIWHHVTGTFDGSTGSTRLYVDGTMVDEVEDGTKKDSDLPLQIGRWTTNDEYYDGKLDDVRIYSRALPPHEVSQLYNPSPGYWSSRFFDAGRPTRFTNLTWTEDLQQSTDVEARVQVGDHVKRTKTEQEWQKGSGSYLTLPDGDGSDGSLRVTQTGTIVNNYTYLTDDQGSGSTSLSVNDEAVFSEGDQVMVIQMQNGTGSGKAGRYEFVDIKSIDSGELVLKNPLKKGYYSGNFGSGVNEVSQVVRVPEYTDLTVDGGSITAPQWDGYTGGIISFRAKGKVQITNSGSITASGEGFRGGVGKTGSSTQAQNGESYDGFVGYGGEGASRGDGANSYAEGRAGGGTGGDGGDLHGTSVMRGGGGAGGADSPDTNCDEGGGGGAGGAYGGAGGGGGASTDCDPRPGGGASGGGTATCAGGGGGGFTNNGCNTGFDGAGGAPGEPGETDFGAPAVNVCGKTGLGGGSEDAGSVGGGGGGGGGDYGLKNLGRIYPGSGGGAGGGSDCSFGQGRNGGDGGGIIFVAAQEISILDGSMSSNGEKGQSADDNAGAGGSGAGGAIFLRAERITGTVNAKGGAVTSKSDFGGGGGGGGVGRIRLDTFEFKGTATPDAYRGDPLDGQNGFIVKDNALSLGTTGTYISQWKQWSESKYNGPTPVSRWEFSQGAGQTVQDTEGDNDGTLGSGSSYGSDDPSWRQNCRTDGCMEFDGSNDYISADPVRLNDKAAIHAWFTVDEYHSGWKAMIASGHTDNDGMSIRITDRDGGFNDYLRLQVLEEDGDLAEAFSESQPVPTDTWHSTTGVANGTHINLYIDGELIDSGTYDGTIRAPTTTEIGRKGTVDAEYWDGRIDDVRIYNTSLTTDEVQSAMTSPKQPFASWQSRGGQDLKPLAHWKFDEGKGQKAYDSVGSNDGTLGGSTSSEASDPTWVDDCRYRGCLDFDGSDDDVAIPDAPGLDGGNHLVISSWMKVDEHEGDNDRPIQKDPENAVYLAFLSSQGTVRWRAIDSSGGKFDITASYTRDRWEHFVYTYNADKALMEIYRNGERVSHGSASSNPIAESSDHLRFGSDDSIDNFFDGKLDDVRIYNRSLSESSIHALYNAPSSSWSSTSLQVRTSAANPEDEDLVGSWSFEGTGQTIVDTSGNGNIGTLGRNVSVEKNEPVRTSGYSGKGLNFRGGYDSYVSLRDGGVFNNVGDFAMAGWIKPDSGTSYNGWESIFAFGGRDGDELLMALEDQYLQLYSTHLSPNDQGKSGSVLEDNKWHHVAITRNGSHFKFFVNGDLDREYPSWDGSNFEINNDRRRIGSDCCPSTSGNSPKSFHGKMDELRIYDRSLSKSEIKDMYRISDFTPSSIFNQGSYFDPNTTTLGGEEFDSQYLQYKVNMLSGDSGSVPSVDKVSVAQASGWTGFSSDDNGSGLNLPDSQFGQVQLKLSSDNPENSPVVDEVSLHTEPEGTDWLCTAPYTGNWVIDRNCTFTGEQDAPGNVRVPSPHKLNITSDGLLGINLREFRLLIESKAKVLIDKLGSVQRVSFPEDCREVLEENPSASSGTYKIDPDGEGGVDPFSVTCEMRENGGGWIKLETENNQPYTTGTWGYFDAPNEEPDYSLYNHISDPIEQDQYPRSCPGETTVDIQYKNPQTGNLYTNNQIEVIQHLLSSISSSTRQVVFSGDDDGDNLQHEVYINGFHMTPFTSGNEEWDYGIYSDESDTTGGVDLENGESVSPLPEEGENILPDEVRFYCDDGNAAGGANSWGYEKEYVLVK